jgi:hypothetical protein
LKEEHRLRVSVNRVLSRIFGPKREEERENWRRLHNELLRSLHSKPNIIWMIRSRRMRWAGHVARMVWIRGANRAFVGKLEGKKTI